MGESSGAFFISGFDDYGLREKFLSFLQVPSMSSEISESFVLIGDSDSLSESLCLLGLDSS